MNPWLTALIGAIAFIVLGVAAVQTTAHRLVDRLRAAAENTLNSNGLGWAQVEMDGQTAVLSGVAPSAAAQADARERVMAADGAGGPVWGGVIAVDDRTTLAAARAEGDEPYAWRAVKVGGTVQITGSVPDAATRAALVEKARVLFPNNVVDRMSVAGNAPQGDWSTAAKAALDALAQLRSGEARLSGTTLIVRGSAANATVASAVNDAIRQPAVGFSGTSEAVVVDGGGRYGAAGDQAGAPRGQAVTDDRIAPANQSSDAPDKRTAEPVDKKGIPAAASDARAGTGSSDACQKRLDAIVSGQDVLFEFGRTRIGDEGQAMIDQVAEVMLSCPDIRLMVVGHSDNQGSEAVNRRISIDRANSVIDRLVDIGIDRERLAAEGYGSSKPVAGNDTEEGRRQNRRIELKVLQ